MFKRSEARAVAAVRPAAASLPLAAALFAALLLTLAAACRPAHATATPEDDRSAFDAAPKKGTAAAAAPGPLRYQMRCWQYGQLVLEENGLELPPDGAAATAVPSGLAGSLRLRAIGPDRQPLYLTETRNATCLMYPYRAERAERTPERVPGR